MNLDEHVQPIVVAMAGTHEDTALAAALACATVWVDNRDDPAWGLWLAGPFGKSVRRARRPAAFERVLAELSADGPVDTEQVGEAVAFAGVPVTYGRMPSLYGSLQVSGTQCSPGDGRSSRYGYGPTLLVDESLDMSTGKTAAQAAHGLLGWLLAGGEDRVVRWAGGRRGATLRMAGHSTFTAALSHADLVVRDAGRTEVDPGSATVAVLPA